MWLPDTVVSREKCIEYRQGKPRVACLLIGGHLIGGHRGLFIKLSRARYLGLSATPP
jgi:hypothetical protein